MFVPQLDKAPKKGCIYADPLEGFTGKRGLFSFWEYALESG